MTTEAVLYGLRWVSLTLWALVIGINMIGGVRSVTRWRRHLDPVWAIFCLAGVNRILFALPRIIDDLHPTVTHIALVMASQGMAIFVALGMMVIPVWFSEKP